MKDDYIEKLDSLKFLSKIHRTEFHERRQYEYKIIFAVLAFYALAAVAICKEDFKIVESLKYCLWLKAFFGLVVAGVFLLVAILSSFFIWGIHKANAFNKGISEDAERKIDELSGLKIIPAKAEAEAGRTLAKRVPCCQIFILFLFAFCAILFVIVRLYL